MNADLNLRLEVSCEQIKITFIKNIIPITRDGAILDMEPFPSPLELAKLAEAVYTDGLVSLPDGWKYLTTAFNKSWGNGYYGAAYWKPSLQQVVIAHRGTKPTNTGALWTNYNSVVGAEYSSQMDSAITFSDLIMTVLDEVNGMKGVSLQLSLTGHSLGAWLAQVTAFTLEYMRRDGDCFVKRHDRPPSRHVHTVTFDTPGCKQMLDKIINDGHDRYRKTMCPDRLDITNYLAPPNRINTTGSHVGTIQLVTFDISKFGRMDKHTPLYNIAIHGINNFVKAFEGEVTIREVLDWPVSSGALGGEEYNEVHKRASHATGYVPDPVEEQQEIMWLKELRYKTKELESSCNVRIFSQQELYLLELWSALKAEAVTIDCITEFVDKHKLGAVNNIFEGFVTCNIENRTVTCQSITSRQTVMRHSKQLMRWFHPEFLEAVQRQSAQIPRVGLLVYQMACRHYLDSLPECQMYFEDTVGLNVFLESREARILHIESEDGQLLVAVLRNLLSRMWGILQTDHSDSYLRPDRQTFVNIEQMRGLYRTVDFDNLYKCGYYGDDLLVIYADSTLAGPDTGIIEKFMNIVYKKLILISPPQTACKSFSGLLNVPSATSRAQLGLSDLTERSQKALFSKVLSVGGKQFALENYTKNIKQFLSHIDRYIDRQTFNEIVTDQTSTLRTDDPLLGHDDLKVNSSVNETVSVTRISRAIKEYSSEAFLMISGIGREQLETDLWRELVRDLKEERVSTGTAERGQSDFKQMCREMPSSTIFWLAASAAPEFVQCKSIYKKEFYIERKFVILKYIFDFRKLAQDVNKHKNITQNNIFVCQKVEDIESLISPLPECIKTAATYEEADDIIEKNPGKAVHILKREATGGPILWQRSRGSLEGLRPYAAPGTSESVDEEGLGNTSPKVVIIADEPGMGKSTSLTSVSRLLRASAWVIRVDLKDFQIPIQNLPSELSLNSVCDFILRDGDGWLRGLLHFCLDKRNEHSRQVYLLFDGFDEIKQNLSSAKAEDEVLRLLRYVDSETRARLWITTRQYRREIIENELSIFAVRFEKIEESRQREYLVAFWRPHLLLQLDQYGDAEESNVERCAGYVFENAKEVLGADVQNFMGIPLQMRMLAEVSVKWVKDAVESDIGETFDVRSVLDLYQTFVERKYEIYFMDKTGLNERMSRTIKDTIVEQLTEKHRLLALFTLFPEFAKEHFDALEAGWGDELCRVGLVRVGGGGGERVEFIHRTLAEYFCADLAVHWLRKRGRYHGLAPVMELLLTEILLRDAHEVISTFIDKLVLSQPLAEDADRFSALQISALWCDEGKQRSLFNKKIGTALHTAVRERNTGIIAILVGGLKWAPVPEGLISFIAAHDPHRYTALGRAAREAGNEEAPETVRRVNTEIMKEFVHSVENCPHEVILELLLATYSTIASDREMTVLSKYVRGKAVYSAIHRAFTRTQEVIRDHIPRLRAAVRAGRVGEVRAVYGSMKSDTERRGILLVVGGKWEGTVLHDAIGGREHEVAAQIIVILCDQNIPQVGRSYDGAGLTPLHCAARAGRLDIVEHFINHGVHIGSLTWWGETALFPAAEGGSLPVVQYLVQKGLDITTVDNGGKTALFPAAEGGSLPVVQYLVQKGLDITTVDTEGQTALFPAARGGSLPVVQYLVEEGLDITTINTWGQTALFPVARGGSLPVVQYLVQKGLDITTVDTEGQTALFPAAQGGSLPVVQYLVQEGLDITTVDNRGKTALDIAKQKKYKPIIEFLKQKPPPSRMH